MFDIGFMELMLIGIVSLLVIGPEKLPAAVRTATLWIGRAKRSFNQVKSEIEREINTDDIRRQLHNESIMADLNKAKKQAESLVKETKENIETLSGDVKTTIETEQAELKILGDSVTSTIPSDSNNKTQEKDAKSKDEDKVSSESVISDTKGASTDSDGLTDTVTKQEPVEDFYNNPPKGRFEQQGRTYSTVTEPTDEEPQASDKQDKA